MPWTVEPSILGRVVIPPHLPDGVALFYTTADFPGSLTAETTSLILGFAATRFAVAATLNTCRQVHGTQARRAGAGADRWIECDDCDALWTDQRQVALGIKVADCLPVTLVDPATSVVANIHAGWRGAARGIVSRTIGSMTAQSRFQASSASAWLGPAIRACCFEVGEEVVAQFEDGRRFSDTSRGRKPYFDLAAATKDELVKSGLAPSSIFDSGLCTRCDGSIFHSYRRSGALAGRNLALVAQ